MLSNLFPSISKVIQNIKKHPQLFWTIFVACVITAGFIVVAQLFITIAQDAQERLVNVRIGSIQDSLSEFVVLKEESRETIDTAIINLMTANPTILDFTFYIKEENKFKVFISSDKQREGEVVESLPFAGQLATGDTKNSYTVELQNPDERLYQTFRSLTQDGEVIGLIETTQTLSQADLIVEENIQKGLVIFIFILLFVMFLFFRHSKIIDYTVLYEDLKQIDQIKDDFISMASHELKTPLTAIRGYSEYITEGKEIPEEYKEYSRRIDVSSKQLTLLVEDMLDVSRLQQGRMMFDMKKILVPEFIKNILPDFQSLAKEKNLTVALEQDGLKFPYITADETKLRQVFINIVGNAIKYTKQGEVKIKLFNDKNKLEIRVSDTGIGMSEDERKHLFEKFYRVRNEETKELKGTGLGLWITKELTEKMNGELSVESIKGVGTHMIMRFDGEV
jgi:signal transduction histidine kinase